MKVILIIFIFPDTLSNHYFCVHANLQATNFSLLHFSNLRNCFCKTLPKWQGYAVKSLRLWSNEQILLVCFQAFFTETLPLWCQGRCDGVNIDTTEMPMPAVAAASG